MKRKDDLPIPCPPSFLPPYFPPAIARLLAVVALLSAFPTSLYAEQEIRADRSETLREGSDILRQFIGAVEAKFGTVQIKADSAHAWIREERYLFMPGVSYRDSVRKVRADTLEYDHRREVASFRGRVEIEERGRMLTAKSVTYRLRQNRLEARGAIGLVYPEEGIAVRAEALWYDAVGDSGEAREQAEVIRTPEEGEDSLRLHTDRLKFYDQGRNLRLAGQVRLWQAGIEAAAETAHYQRDEGRLELGGNPQATWRQRGGANWDSVAIRADRLLFTLEGGRVRDVLLSKGAEIHMESRREEGVDRRSVRADTARMKLLGDRLKGMEAWEGVRVCFRAGDGATTDLRADRIQMFFGEEDLDSLETEGGCTATYVPAGKEAVSHLSGERISIRFQGQKIQRVSVSGEAICEQTPAVDREEENIYLTGDRVELTFEGGKLQKTDATGGVQGHYVPVKKEEQR